jgi:HAD superfamily hydrolase (TIGR01509 family)
MIRTILFDLDGTIIDSEPAALQAILDCTAAWGVPVTRDQAAVVAGKKWEVAFDLLYQTYPMPLPLPEASRQIVARYQEITHRELPVVPGVVEAIEEFSKAYTLALVSGSYRKDILWALGHLGVEKHFSCILGAEDYAESKPSPDGYRKAMGLLHASPAESLVFEDSAAGIASAIAAGVRVVAIESTNHFHHDQSPAHARIKDFRGIGTNWIARTFP